jgi:acylphosphatase
MKALCMTAKAGLKAIVRGRVQGVSFRAFVRQKAEGLALTGFVRNWPSGEEVEVQAEGDQVPLEKLVTYLKTGPPGAKVERVTLSWSKYTGNYRTFEIRY